MIYTPTPMRNGKIRSFHSKQSQLYTPKNMIYALTLTPQVHPVVPLHQVIWRRRAPRGPRGPKRAILNRTETWGFQWRKHGDKSIFTFFFCHTNRFRFSIRFQCRILLGFHQHNLRFNIQTLWLLLNEHGM